MRMLKLRPVEHGQLDGSASDRQEMRATGSANKSSSPGDAAAQRKPRVHLVHPGAREACPSVRTYTFAEQLAVAMYVVMSGVSWYVTCHAVWHKPQLWWRSQGLLALPFRSSYSASKHALQAFANALRAEVAGRGAPVLLDC
jgi:NAD(P)-dependent dehydrogenase (short-subunit alcohol dehydrogenase family)